MTVRLSGRSIVFADDDSGGNVLRLKLDDNSCGIISSCIDGDRSDSDWLLDPGDTNDGAVDSLVVEADGSDCGSLLDVVNRDSSDRHL